MEHWRPFLLLAMFHQGPSFRVWSLYGLYLSSDQPVLANSFFYKNLFCSYGWDISVKLRLLIAHYLIRVCTQCLLVLKQKVSFFWFSNFTLKINFIFLFGGTRNFVLKWWFFIGSDVFLAHVWLQFRKRILSKWLNVFKCTSISAQCNEFRRIWDQEAVLKFWARIRNIFIYNYINYMFVNCVLTSWKSESSSYLSTY